MYVLIAHHNNPNTLVADATTTQPGDTTRVLCRTECAQRRWVPFVLVTTSAGLLIVDHIHFQYNGFLLGVLLASCVAMGQRRILVSAALFSILLNLKHLYLVLAPVYFVVILRGWCWGRGRLRRLCTVGALVVCVFAVSLGPFVAMGQAGTLLSRCAAALA